MNITAERIDHHVALTGDWSLWRDFAIRSSGFPVEGLEAFGPDEDARLAAVARDPAFREAVAWQSRESLARAVDKLAAGARRQPVAARAAGRTSSELLAALLLQERHDRVLRAAGVGLVQRAGRGYRGALGRAGARARRAPRWRGGGGAAAGVTTPLPMGPFPERALPAGTPGLERLQAARDAVTAARREDVPAALDQLDRVFEAITGRPAARAEGDSGGGRTVAYLDSMRDLDVTLGPALLDELRSSLPPVLAASRWWCGRVFDRGAELLGRIAHGRSGPLAPLLGELMGAGFGLGTRCRRSSASCSAAGPRATPSPTGRPAWHGSGYHSADLQIAAASTDAAARGDFLVVLGDFHGATTRSARACSACAIPIPPGCCAASPPRPGRASTSLPRAAGWSR